MKKTYDFHVSGTHCAACKILIEDILGEERALVSATSVDLAGEKVRIETGVEEAPEILAERLTEKLRPHGYALSIEKSAAAGDKGLLWQALPIGLFILALFFWLQKSGILNVGLGNSATPATSFIIGLVASVSSCLAIVGGLVLSLSAKISEDSVSDTKSFVLFHASRVVSFAVLGGVLGAIGGALGVNFTLTAVLGILAALVMLALGLSLVGVFAKNKLTIGSGFFEILRRIEHKTLTPVILGFATFFLPCGFTQAMQVAALGSGSALSGAMIMLAFSLGTLPMLLLLSFGSASFAHGRHAPLFFKSAGVVVVGLGIFALLSGLASLGVIPPLFNI